MSTSKYVDTSKLDETSDKAVNSAIILVIGILACVILRSPTAWYAILSCIGMLIMWELIEIKHTLWKRED